jgi:putative phage-type endonuclease
MSLSPEQLETRRLGITATDVSAVLGVNPYRAPIDVYRDKVEGRPDVFEESVSSQWGQLLEPLIRTDYERRHGVRVEVPGTLRAPGEEWIIATPDGLVYQGDDHEPDRGIEIKVHGRAAIVFGRLRYGEPGTDDVPLHELCQCAWGMAATGLRRWDLIPFLDGAPSEYIIDRDDELIGSMVEASRRFMHDYVIKRTPPPVDGSDSWDLYLKGMWSKNSLDLVDVTENGAIRNDIDSLRVLKEQHAVIENRIDTIVQRLKLEIKDAAGLKWRPDIGKEQAVTWKRNKESTVTDWLGVLGEFRASAALVASGKALELDAIEAVLRRLGGGFAGSSTFSGIALAETFTLVKQTLMDISRASCEPRHQVKKVGNRPFLVPRSWKQSAKKADDK